MKGTPPEKWIEDVSTDDRIGVVAARSLEHRLRAIQQYFAAGSGKG